MCCNVLQCVAERCSVLQCLAVCSNAFQCVAVCCSTPQCVIVYYNVLQCVAVCCSVLQCVTQRRRVLQCAPVHCSVLQHATVPCSVSVYCSVSMRVKVCSTMLQRVVAHLPRRNRVLHSPKSPHNEYIRSHHRSHPMGQGTKGSPRPRPSQRHNPPPIPCPLISRFCDSLVVAGRWGGSGRGGGRERRGSVGWKYGCGGRTTPCGIPRHAPPCGAIFCMLGKRGGRC